MPLLLRRFSSAARPEIPNLLLFWLATAAVLFDRWRSATAAHRSHRSGARPKSSTPV